MRIYVVGEITQKSFKTFSKQLDKIERLAAKDPSRTYWIEAIIHSDGGVADSALAYVQRIRTSSVKFITTGMGHIASAATIILAAGDKRRMGREATLMTHEDQFEDIKGSTSAIEAEAKHCRRLDRHWNKMMEKLTGTKASEWEELNARGDVYLTAQECLKLGIIDEVV